MIPASDAMSVATIETNMDTWKPGDVHHLVPTLVLMCGKMDMKDAISIQVNVRERLGPSVPANAVRWEQIKSIEDASEERIKGLLAPFLKLEYVEDLSAGGFLETPSKEELLDLQIIVVYDLTGQDKADASFLQKMESALGKLLSKGAEASLPLLVIGEGEPDLGRQTTYWPRFRLQSRTYSGLVADRERILEVCQNLIVALVTSELVRAIDHKVGPDRGSVGWIWIGASALVVDLVGMREFVRHSIFHELVQPMIKAEFTADVRHQIEVGMQDQVQAIQAKNLASAMSIVSKHGWFAKSEEGTKRITQMDLKPEDELTVKIFEPGSNLAVDLSERYEISRRSLIRHLGERAGEEFGKLREGFAFRMDPRPEDYDSILDTTRKVESQDTLLSLRQQLLPGLAAATFAVEKAAEYMTKSRDINYPGLSPHPVGSGYYLAATAKLDANTIHGKYRRYRRHKKTMLSPQGFILKLVPAWPFLTAMILVLTDWHRILASLVAALLLSGLGIIQFMGLRRSLANLWKRVRSDIQRTVRLSVLGVIANVLWGYRILVAGQLTEMAFNLKNLRSLLAWEDTKSLRRIAESKAKSDAHFKGQTTVYWLADWDRYDDHVPKAIASAAPRDFYSSIAEIIVKSVVGGDGQPTTASEKPEQSYRFVFNKIERWVEQLTEEVFYLPELKAHALAGKESPLKDGKRWKWLYEKAEPLGGGAFAKSFTVFAGENPAAYDTTTAALVKDSPYWVPGCQIAMSRQQHEISCIRGVIEDMGEQHGLD